jgi:hypothetical protein
MDSFMFMHYTDTCRFLDAYIQHIYRLIGRKIYTFDVHIYVCM